MSPDDSRVYVTGQSPGTGEGIPPRDYATVAYDAATGDELWVVRYDGPGNGDDLVQSMGVSPDGSGVFVTGFSRDPATVWDYATVAYDAADGSQLWVSRYDGPAHATDQASAMTVSRDGSGVFVTGVSAGTGTGFDYATVAYHPTSGSQLWVARYNGATNGFDRPADEGIAVSPDGSRVYVTGESAGVGTGFAPRDYATVAYEAVNGDEVWAARHSLSQGRDAATALGVSPDGSRVFVTGLSLSSDGGTNYVTLAHDAADGNARWVGQYDGPGTGADFPNALAVSPDGSHVYAAGHSLGVDSGVDFATVAYDAEADGEFPVFVPHDLRIEPGAVAGGDPVRISVAVTNVGTAAGGREVTLLVDGTVEDSTSVTLEPGQATQVAWTVTRELTGTYAVQVGHLSGEFRVTPDLTGPDVTVSGVVDGRVYGDSKSLPISWTAVDPSGVDTVEGTLDGEPFVSGSVLPLYQLSLGEHLLEVTAMDEAGNTTTMSVAFTTRTSYQDVAALVERFRSDGTITLAGAIKLQAKLIIAALLDLFGLDKQAIKQLKDFRRFLDDRHVVSDATVREVLTRDVDALTADLRDT